jgi:micrococcal nuclease
MVDLIRNLGVMKIKMKEFHKSSIFNLQFSLPIPSAFFIVIFVILATQSSPAQTWHAVKWIDDGDTIVLTTGQRIRYLGINAPEIDHKQRKAQPFGYQARSFNKNLLSNRHIRLEFDIERYDQYGRLLAYVFLPDGSLVNSRLLLDGMAFYLYRWPNVKYEKILFQAQLAAMASGKGLWHKWKEDNDRYIGNLKSRRFHAAACPYARKIKRTNRIEFASKWEAFRAGYAPAKECIVQFWSYEEKN